MDEITPNYLELVEILTFDLSIFVAWFDRPIVVKMLTSIGKLVLRANGAHLV